MAYLPFRNRAEAGRLLGAELARRGFGPDSVVLALPRGGVPVGSEVADVLRAPLDVLVVRKLGVPWQPELAMGAIAGGMRVLDQNLIRELQISPKEVEQVTARETEEMEKREKLYRSGLSGQDLRGRRVILVDDGLATGATMIAAVRCVREMGPQELIVAVPVGSTEACRMAGQEADQCICLAMPDPFRAVGEWYEDFRSLGHEEVQDILRAHSIVRL